VEFEPSFFDKANAYLVGVDPTESLEDLANMIPEGFIGWVPALPSTGLLIDFDVKVQSTKILLDTQGDIIHREGYGSFDIEELISIIDRES
jgi:hypothetical protein